LIQRVDGGISRGELRLMAKDGSRVPVNVSISALDPGTGGSVCVVITDLTEHQRNQKLIAGQAVEHTKRTEAEAGQRRIASILESITDSFFSLNREWRITDADQRAAANFGKTRDEFVGSLWWDLSPRGQIQELDEQYLRAMTDRVPGHLEAPSAAAKGRWFERHIYPTDDGLAVYFRDISERKGAEEQLREANEKVQTILDSISDNFFGFSRDYRYTYLNSSAAEQIRRLGKDPDRIIGKVLWDEFPDAPNEKAIRRVMSERIAITDELYYPAHGEWVENHMYPSRDGGLVIIQKYVSQRKRAEAELSRSEALLAEGQKMSHTGSWVWHL
jgi:PAS domain S-box-containing protein